MINMTTFIPKSFFRISLLCLFACISFTGTAQDQKAKDLLNQVTAKIKSYETIVIDFKYALNNSKENINQESKGNVTMKGNMYVLNLMGVTKLFDGKKPTQSILKMKKLPFLNTMKRTKV